MIRLIKIDFRKYFYNRTFWVLTVMYLLLMVVVFFGMESFLNNIVKVNVKNASIPIPKFSLYSFPYVWQNMAYLAGYFKIFPALITLIFITSEFNYKTLRQNVMNGMSRAEFLVSKVIFVFLYSFLAALILFLSSLFLGLTHTPDEFEGSVFTHSGFALAYLLEIFTFSSFGLMTGFLVKRSGLAIGTLILYYFILERIIAYYLPDSIGELLPAYVIRNLIDVPNSSLMKLVGFNFREFVEPAHVFLCLGYSALFLLIVWLVLRKKDL